MQEEKGTTEDEMAGWHHWLNGHESEWTPGVGDGQGGRVCCSSWGCKESDMTVWLNWTEQCKRVLFSQHLCQHLLFVLYIKKIFFNSKGDIHSNVHSSIIYSCQDMELILSIHQQINKEDVIHTHTHTHTHLGILLSYKKGMKFCHLQQHGWTWKTSC